VGAFLHLGAASVFDSVTGEEIARFDGHGERPRGAIFHSAAMAYSVGPDGFVRGWDPNNGVEVLAVPGGLDPRAIAISGDGTHLIVFDSTSSARIVDLRPGAGVEIDRGSGSLFEPMEWGSDDGFVRVNVTDLYTGYRIFNESSPSFLDITVDTPLPLPSSGTTDPPGRFVFIPGTHRVLVAFANKMVLVDGDTLSVIAEREWGPEGPLPSELLVGSPDGRFVVGTSEYPFTSGGPPDIEVVDARTLERLLLIERAHAGTIADLKVSQTGDLIASGSRDEWVRVWSSSDGTLTHAMHAPGPVHGIAFSDDDRHLTVTLDDATTYEYTLDPDELLDIARSRLSRGFTTTECRTYGLDPCPGLEEMLQP
jgi:WD40 repeat protein